MFDDQFQSVLSSAMMFELICSVSFLYYKSEDITLEISVRQFTWNVSPITSLRYSLVAELSPKEADKHTLLKQKSKQRTEAQDLCVSNIDACTLFRCKCEDAK